MKTERLLTIDALHERVSGANTVLSMEAPLTLALDQRVARPRIGRLAAIPRSHASGELVPEDQWIVLTGIIDLLHVSEDRVDISDYKADPERHAHEEYRIQGSIYWHVL